MAPVADSPLEEAGFESSVPRKTPAVVVISGSRRAAFSVAARRADTSPSLETLVVSRGTDGSIRLWSAAVRADRPGFSPFRIFSDVNADLAIDGREAGSIADQAAGCSRFAPRIR